MYKIIPTISLVVFLAAYSTPASAAIENLPRGPYVDEFTIMDDSGRYYETDEGLAYQPDAQQLPSYNYPGPSDLGSIEPFEESDLNWRSINLREVNL